MTCDVFARGASFFSVSEGEGGERYACNAKPTGCGGLCNNQAPCTMLTSFRGTTITFRTCLPSIRPRIRSSARAVRSQIRPRRSPPAPSSCRAACR